MTPEALKAVYQDSNSWQQVADAVNTATGEYKVIGCNDPTDKHLVGKTLHSNNPMTDCYAKATQSKGEWTVEMVEATLKDRPFAASTIASHHNAALAAAENVAREQFGIAKRMIDAKNEAEQQLAAEREKSEYYHQLWLSERKDYDQLAAAEREKVKSVAHELELAMEAMIENQQLRQQLNDAREIIALRDEQQASDEKQLDAARENVEIAHRGMDHYHDQAEQLQTQLAAAVEALNYLHNRIEHSLTGNLDKDVEFELREYLATINVALAKIGK